MINKKLIEQINEILGSMDDTAPAMPAIAPTQRWDANIDWRELAKATVDQHHARQDLKDLWPITGVERYIIDDLEFFVVVCTRFSTIILPDETVQHQCYVHTDIVLKRGATLQVIAPCDDLGNEGKP